MEEQYAMFGVLAIVLVAVFAFSFSFSVTGEVASNAYGYNKVYGGAVKKVEQNPSMFGKAFAKRQQNARWWNFLYENRDEWDCSYDKETALASDNPCFLNGDVNTYCCVDLDLRAVAPVAR